MADFSIYLNSELSFSDVTFQSSAYVPSSEFGRDGDDIVQVVGKYNTQNRQIGLFQFPSDRPKYYFMLSFSDYSRNNLMDINASLNMSQAIILPLPSSLKDAQTVSFADESLGMMVGAGVNATYGTVKGARSISDVGQNILNAGQNAMNNVGNLGAGEAATVGATALNDNVSSLVGSTNPLASVLNQGQNIASAVFGYSPNEFMTILLKGPTYKRYSFSWNLAPKNARESEVVRQIIRYINNSMAPGLAAGGMLFSFPKIASLAFMPNYKHLFRFKPAVISNFAIDYSPGGVAFYHSRSDERGARDENPPESVNIMIEFQELEYWLKGDFLNGGGPDDTNGGPLRNANQEDLTIGDIAASLSTASANPVNLINNAINVPVGD